MVKLRRNSRKSQSGCRREFEPACLPIVDSKVQYLPPGLRRFRYATDHSAPKFADLEGGLVAVTLTYVYILSLYAMPHNACVFWVAYKTAFDGHATLTWGVHHTTLHFNRALCVVSMNKCNNPVFFLFSSYFLWFDFHSSPLSLELPPFKKYFWKATER